MRNNKKNQANSKSTNSLEYEILKVINNDEVQKDRIVRLAMLSILNSYHSGCYDILYFDILNSICFLNIIENYHPKLFSQINNDNYQKLYERFCGCLDCMVIDMYNSCYIIEEGLKYFDAEKFDTLYNQIKESTMVERNKIY